MPIPKFDFLDDALVKNLYLQKVIFLNGQRWMPLTQTL